MAVAALKTKEVEEEEEEAKEDINYKEREKMIVKNSIFFHRRARAHEARQRLGESGMKNVIRERLRGLDSRLSTLR